MKPIQFLPVSGTLKGKPEEEFLNELMLRSMKKGGLSAAEYRPFRIGLFALHAFYVAYPALSRSNGASLC